MSRVEAEVDLYLPPEHLRVWAATQPVEVRAPQPVPVATSPVSALASHSA
jgi:hypothetical protein